MNNQSTIAEDPKEIVWDMMTSFSERMWSARWASGLEFLLWKKVRKCSPDLSLREIADLNFYAGLRHGMQNQMLLQPQEPQIFRLGMVSQKVLLQVRGLDHLLVGEE